MMVRRFDASSLRDFEVCVNDLIFDAGRMQMHEDSGSLVIPFWVNSQLYEGKLLDRKRFRKAVLRGSVPADSMVRISTVYSYDTIDESETQYHAFNEWSLDEAGSQLRMSALPPLEVRMRVRDLEIQLEWDPRHAVAQVSWPEVTR